jgi:hypothetical protein
MRNMKASELRIGNLVDLGNRIAKISEIYHNACTVLDLEETQDTIEDYERTKPIPLTEEWLLNFDMELTDGFSNSRKLYLNNYENDISKITYSPKEGLLRLSNGDPKGTILIPHIKYVHQLQNLYFALTGEELILNI